MAKKYWFVRKKYGWGWTPTTWQGWLVILIWAIGVALSAATFDHEWLKNLLVIGFLTLILLFICYKKGESPKWQWGEK